MKPTFDLSNVRIILEVECQDCPTDNPEHCSSCDGTGFQPEMVTLTDLADLMETAKLLKNEGGKNEA